MQTSLGGGGGGIETLQIGGKEKNCKPRILRHNKHTPNANNNANGRHYHYTDNFSLNKLQSIEHSRSVT